MEFYISPEHGTPDEQMLIWRHDYLPKIRRGWEEFYQIWSRRLILKVLDVSEGGYESSNLTSKQCRTYSHEKVYKINRLIEFFIENFDKNIKQHPTLHLKPLT